MATTLRRRLWLCVDLGLADLASWMEDVRAWRTVNPLVWWLRAPGLDGGAMLAAAQALRDASRGQGAALVIGERVDVAIAVGADGVHLGERSLSAARARTVSGGTPLGISRAVHDPCGGRTAAAEGADVLVAAPFLPVPGKGPPLGPGGLAHLRGAVPNAWWLALGGIERAEVALRARAVGADGVVLRRACRGPAGASLVAVLSEALDA